MASDTPPNPEDGSKSDDAPYALIVEDDAFYRHLLSHFLNQRQWETVVTQGHAEAIARFAARPPDLAIIDWMLPEGDGLSLLQALRRLPEGENVPVLLISAADVIGTIDRTPLGIAATLHKPIEWKQLNATLHAILGDRWPLTVDDDVSV